MVKQEYDWTEGKAIQLMSEHNVDSTNMPAGESAPDTDNALHVISIAGEHSQISSALEKRVQEMETYHERGRRNTGCTIQNVCGSLFRQVEKNLSAADPSYQLKYNEQVLEMVLGVKDHHNIDISGALNLPPKDYVRACYMMLFNRVVDNERPWEELIKNQDEVHARKLITRGMVCSVEAMVHDVHLVNDPYGIQPSKAQYRFYRFARKLAWLKRAVKRG